jgi:hypothetical protein
MSVFDKIALVWLFSSSRMVINLSVDGITARIYRPMQGPVTESRVATMPVCLHPMERVFESTAYSAASFAPFAPFLLLFSFFFLSSVSSVLEEHFVL